MIVHPKCGKQFPSNNRHGHCSACCQTFAGLQSFDAHRVGEHGTDDRRCTLLPYENGLTEAGKPKYGHWTDEAGYIHYGKRLTEDEKKEIWG